MKLNRYRVAVTAVLVAVFLGWLGAGVAAAESKWHGVIDDSLWTVVPQDSKWL